MPTWNPRANELFLQALEHRLVEILDALAQDHRVFAPDIVYFGKSAKPERHPQHQDFVDFCQYFMDTFELDRALLVGNSMGGAIAAKAAMLYPERVAGLVLVERRRHR